MKKLPIITDVTIVIDQSMPLSRAQIKVLESLQYVDWNPVLTQIGKVNKEPLTNNWQAWQNIKKKSTIKITVELKEVKQ